MTLLGSRLATSTSPHLTAFPASRLRRLRGTESMRQMVRETRLEANDFIYPLFVTHGQSVRQEISSMPGNYQLSIDELLAEVEETARLGIPGVLLFGLPASK